jgi:hypothetical protein
MRLREMLAQHAAAEIRFVPRDFFALDPWCRWGSAVKEINEVHGDDPLLR